MSPALCGPKCLVLIGLLFAFPALVRSQSEGLQGVDFPVTPALRGDQTFPSVAFGPNGGFFTWQDNITDPSGLGVSARRLNAGLVPEGSVFQVNQTMGLDQGRPKVAMLPDGGGIVVFQSGRPGGQNVLARILSSSGAPAGDEVLVNNAAFKTVNRFDTNWVLIRNNKARTQRYRIREKITARHEFNANPSAAVLNDGSVVVAYASSRVYDTNTFVLRETLRWDDKKSIFLTNRVRIPYRVRVEAMQDVYVQRLSALGQKLGEEVRINEFVNFNQRDAAVAALDNGNFVIAWVSEQQRFNDSVDVYARVFDALGNPMSGETLVNTVNRPSGSPSVAGTAGGGFTVTWSQRSAQRTNGLDILARTFAANGAATSDAFGVNTFTFGDQFSPSIANLGTQQLLVWNSMGQDGSWEGVFARAFNGATALGDEFRVNVGTRFSQMHPRVAGDGSGRAVTVWSSYTPESAFELVGRLYVAP